MTVHIPTVTDAALVTLGPVDLYWEAVPADVTARDLLIPAAESAIEGTGSWARIGNLQEGLQVNRSNSEVTVKPDVDISTVLRAITQMDIELTGELTEIDFDQIKILGGVGELVVTVAAAVAQEGFDTMDIGSLVPAYTSYAIAWEGVNHRGFYERGFLWECRVQINGARARRRGQEERVPFSIAPMARKDLADISEAYGLYGCEQKMTAAATAV